MKRSSDVGTILTNDSLNENEKKKRLREWLQNQVTTLYRIELPYAVFGITCQNDRVVHAAPMGRWMMGKPLSTIETWVIKKKGKIIRLPHGAIG